jgi:hypothetical protein
VSLEAFIARLQRRVADADLVLLANYARDPATLRALEILAANLEARIEELERDLLTDERIMDAIEEHGGVRPAARALNVDPSVVTRCRQRVLRSATPKLLNPARDTK